jgi:hypothetical protein
MLLADGDKGREMFRATQGKGFDVTFANGWTVSVQWGPRNYCANRHPLKREELAATQENHQIEKYPELNCSNAEMIAWQKVDGKCVDYIDESGRCEFGWRTPDEVAAFMSMIAAK